MDDRGDRNPTHVRRWCSPCAVAMLLQTFALSGSLGCKSTENNPYPDGAIRPPTAYPEITIKTYLDSSYTGATANVTLVAYQDGNGPWKVLTGTGGVYHTPIASERYSVAVACSSATRSSVQVYFRTVAEQPELATLGCPPASSPDRVKITAHVSGLGVGEVGDVAIGDGTIFSVANGDHALEVTKGASDVIARSFRSAANTNVAFYRGPTLDLETDQAVTIDFAQGQAPQSEALTVSALDPSESLDVTTELITTAHRAFTLGSVHYAASALPSSYEIPAVRNPGDLILLSVTATASDGVRTRNAALYAAMPTAATIALPVSWRSPTPSEPQFLDAPFRRSSVTFPIVPLSLHTATYEVRSLTESIAHDVTRSWQISFSQQWAADAKEVSLTAPDLSHLPGWRPEMGLLPGVPVSWTMSRTESDSLIAAGASDGAQALSNTASGEFSGPKACVAGAACTIDLTGCLETQKNDAWKDQSILYGKLELDFYTTHLNWVCQTSILQAWPVVPEPLWWCGTVYNQCTCSKPDGCH